MMEREIQLLRRDNMRTTKRVIGLFLVIAIVCTLVVIPASALDPEWNTLFRKFDPTTKRNYQTGYTKLIQRFMQKTIYSSYIDDHGGVDGIFGDGTAQAVKLFQGDNGLNPDGDVGEKTWGTIAACMIREGLYFKRNGGYIGRYENNNGTLYIYQISDYDHTGTFVCERTA